MGNNIKIGSVKNSNVIGGNVTGGNVTNTEGSSKSSDTSKDSEILGKIEQSTSKVGVVAATVFLLALIVLFVLTR